MTQIPNLLLKIVSAIIFVLLIVFTYYLLIPKNIFFLFVKLIFIIPTIALIVNLVNLIPKNIISSFQNICCISYGCFISCKLSFIKKKT